MSEEQPNTTTTLPLLDNGLAKSAAVSDAKVTGRSRLFLIPLFLLTLFSGAVIGMYFQPPGLRVFFNATGLEPGAGTQTPIAVAIQQVKSKKEIAVVSEGDVVALGRIIPRGDVIHVATPSGAGDARIAEILVAAGDQVQKTDVLAILDNLPQLKSVVAAAEATISVREANLSQTRASIRASGEEAHAALDGAEATSLAAQSDLTRATPLFENGVITRAVFDQIIARANEAGRDVERNIATVSRYDTGSDAVQADIAVAQANLEAARADLDRARQDLARAYVRAPESGRILDVNARVGESPPATGIIDLGDTSQMTVEVEVYQTLIGRVAVGDPVTVTAEALKRDLTGVVSAIGFQIGRQSIVSDDPAANTDARVVDVIVMLDPISSDLASRYTNLEAIVRIDAGRAE